MNDRLKSSKFFVDTEKPTSSFPELIADSVPAIIFVYDLDAKEISYVNKKFKSQFEGVFPHLSNGRQDILDDIIHAEDLSFFKKQLSRLKLLPANDQHFFNCRLKLAGSDERFFEITASVLDSNTEGAQHVLLIANDITDQVKNQKLIEAKTMLFEETESLLEFGTWTWEPSTGHIAWSSGMYKLFGYSGEDEIGGAVSTDFISKHVTAEYKDAFAQLIVTAAETPHDFEFEFNIETKHAETKTLSCKGRAVIEQNTTRYVGVMRDVTLMRNLQEEQERHVRNLNRSNKELEEFAYVASHDLQEPLRKIAMFSERLKSKHAAQLDSEAQLFMDRILVSADNMKILIDNLLEFSRANRSSKAFEVIDLSTIFDLVRSNLELKIDETKAKITFKEKLPTVEAVPSEMQQLFTNLISNAIKFRSSERDCHIEIISKKLSKDDKKKFNLKASLQYYSVEVNDNGIGFEEEYAEKIFQIFQRLHGKAEYPGSGIGLAICKRIVENHNGTIFANSSPGQGASFTVILPEKQF